MANGKWLMAYSIWFFTPLEIMFRCSLLARGPPSGAEAPLGRSLGRRPSGPEAAAGLDFRIIPGSTPEGVPPRRGFRPVGGSTPEGGVYPA